MGEKMLDGYPFAENLSECEPEIPVEGMESEVCFEDDSPGCRHYIAVENGLVVDGWSNGPHPEKSVEGAICICERGGYPFRLFPDGEENPPLCTMDGVRLYRWDGEQVISRTQQ